MNTTSILLSGDTVIAEWTGNAAVTTFFAEYADAFECNGDAVELLITRDMVNDLIHEIEDYLEGLSDNSVILYTEPTFLESTLVYREELSI